MTKYTRYRTGSASSYGILDGESIREIAGDLFGGRSETGATHRLADVKLLYPCQPTKILCVGLNYKSHLGGRPQPSQPEIFYKPLSALQDPGGPIAIPRDATDLHYEGELVVVMGKRVKNVTVDEARDAIFGVTCGNDVSERNWQHGAGKDLQWWRAKGSDTFAPFGPVIVTGKKTQWPRAPGWLNDCVAQTVYTGVLNHREESSNPWLRRYRPCSSMTLTVARPTAPSVSGLTARSMRST